MSHTRIHPTDLLVNASADLCILDVRTAAEVKARSLPGCIHIPLHELTPQRLQQAIAESGKDGSCVYLLCQGGKRAELAAEQLAGQVDAKLCIVDGGIQAVQAANFPLQETARKVIPLERQVRIAAGLLVLTGALLGTLVHPGYYGLSAFVGAGLVFAGITDICPMGMMIARMPWNR